MKLSGNVHLRPQEHGGHNFRFALYVPFCSEAGWDSEMPSTTEIGDRFRDAMTALLSAAGFQCTTEVLIESKKVDIVAKKFTQIEGAQTLLIETKCYTGNVDKDECISFSHEYGQLIDNKHGDRAWLISKTDISAAGKLLITNNRRLACFTMTELQRRLFNVESYLQDLVES